MPRPRRSPSAPRLALMLLALVAGAAPARATLVVAEYTATYTNSEPPGYWTKGWDVGDTFAFRYTYDSARFQLVGGSAGGPGATYRIEFGPRLEPLTIYVRDSAPGEGPDTITLSEGLHAPYPSLANVFSFGVTDPTGTALSSAALPLSEDWARFTQGWYAWSSEWSGLHLADLGPPAAPAPEPGTLATAGLGLTLAGLGAARRRSGGSRGSRSRGSAPD